MPLTYFIVGYELSLPISGLEGYNQVIINIIPMFKNYGKFMFRFNFSVFSKFTKPAYISFQIKSIINIFEMNI